MVVKIDDMGVLPRLMAIGKHAEAPIQKEVQTSLSGPGGGKLDVSVIFALSEEGLALSRGITDAAGRSHDATFEASATEKGFEMSRSLLGPDGRGVSASATVERGEDAVVIRQQVTLPDGRVIERNLEVNRSETGVEVSGSLVRPDGTSVTREDSLSRSEDGVLRELRLSTSGGAEGRIEVSVVPDPDGEGVIVTGEADPGETPAAGDEDPQDRATDILA